MKKNMIHFQLKAVSSIICLSFNWNFCKKKNKQHLAKKSCHNDSCAFSEKENWSPESWSNLHAYENMKHKQVFSSYLKTNASVHMI